MRYLFTVLIVFSTFLLTAQVEGEDLKVNEINGKEYYIHIVDSGNTLYAISRKFAISIEQLKAENPRLTDQLTIGDRLLIPLSAIKRKDLKESPDIDGNFLIHEVQRKNTLYSIAKDYHVEINDIVAVNPEVEKGLKKGMKIKIPVSKIKSDSDKAQYIEPAANSPYVTHDVLPKQTLYSLAKQYDVSIDSIKKVNNGLAGGLKEGQTINLPILKEYKDTTKREGVSFDSSAVKPNYNVVLLLPFYLDMQTVFSDTSYRISEKLSKQHYSKAKYAIEFYQGFMLAADSLEKHGLKMNLRVFDTANDSATVAEILTDTSLSNTDLFIGPLYLDNFMMVSDYAKLNEINIVSPVKLSNKILLGNNFVSKVVTSEPVLNKFLGSYIYDSLRYDNVLCAYPDHVEERKRMEFIKKEYYRLSSSSNTNNDTNGINLLKEVVLGNNEVKEIKSRLDTARMNTIVVPSANQAFVTQLLTVLYDLDEEEYDIKVIGMPEWQYFNNIEIDYLNQLNVHLLVSEFIDSESKDVKQFEKKFYTLHKTIPESFSFLGFDVGYYYLSLLNSFGTNFQLMLLGVEDEVLSRKFQFFKTGFESGYENHSSYILRYTESKLVRVY